MNITGENEKNIRLEIKTILEGLPVEIGNVFERRRLITDRADFVKKLSVLAADVKEIRFAEISLLQFDDSEDEGCDDEPVCILTYGLHLFQEFKDSRSDDTNSDASFNASILAIRNYFLYNRDMLSGKAQAEPVTQPEFSQFGQDTLTDCTGHFADLILRVNYYGDQE